MPKWHLHQGDALTILPTLPTATTDLVLADPPYNSGGRTTGERTTATARNKYVSSDAQHTLPDFAGDSRDQRSYTAWLTMILAQCLRVARDGSSLLIFTDWRQLPSTSDALQAGGWTWRGIIVWRKPIARPQRDGFRRECEYILWGSHGEPRRHQPPIYLPGWYSASQPRGNQRRHITAKPVSLLTELMTLCPPDGTVLDPFAGSGSAGVAAVASGRHYIGVEITEHYAAVAQDRLREALTTPR